MFYALNDNVYFVKGKTRGCIYDFNTSMLYSLNNMLSQKIDMMNKGKLYYGEIDEELKRIIDMFIQTGVIILSKTPLTREIDEIRNIDKQISFAWIEITNRCNLRCRHCYNESSVYCNMDMTLDDYKIAINSILKLGIKKIQIIGGEPFLNPKVLKEMIDYTIGKFQFIEIFTNGTLISQEWYEYLANNSIHIALSVYSYEEDQHDMVTGCKGSWYLTNKTIEELKKHRISYRVCNVLMKDIEIGDISTELYRLSEEKDIVRMSGRANFSLLSDDLIRKKLITKKTFQKPIQKSFCSTVLSGHNCFGSKLYIAADMSVYPCVMERRIKHGKIDVKKGITLDEKICRLTKDKISICCDCEYRYACFDCRPNSLSDNINEKPWFCTYNPQTGKWDNEDEFILKLKDQWGNLHSSI